MKTSALLLLWLTAQATLAAPPDPLLIPGNASDWHAQKQMLKTNWQDILGQFPKDKPPLSTEVISTEQLPGFTRQHIRYQVEPDVFTDGYLLAPRPASGKRPGIVVFHATTEFGPRGPAGLEPAYTPERQQGVHLVEQGYVVWCPRNYINTPGTNWAGNAALVLQKHPGWTGMTRMTWEAIRAADFMESLPQVDRTRIGCFGHSLGAKQVLYAMAFDERYRAGVFSEGGIGLTLSNWEAPWYLGDQIRKPAFRREHHELLACIAPRPFLLLAGGSADDDRSATFIDAVRPVYTLLGAADKLVFTNHHGGHPYCPQARSAAQDFLRKFL